MKLYNQVCLYPFFPLYPLLKKWSKKRSDRIHLIHFLEKWSKKATRQKSYKGSREKVTKQLEKKKN